MWYVEKYHCSMYKLSVPGSRVKSALQVILLQGKNTRLYFLKSTTVRVGSITLKTYSKTVTNYLKEKNVIRNIIEVPQ